MESIEGPWPKNISLKKLATLDTAKYPQEERYPSGITVRDGLMWQHTVPRIGERFGVMAGKLHGSFLTSKVSEIKKEGNKWILITMNSKYELTITE